MNCTAAEFICNYARKSHLKDEEEPQTEAVKCQDLVLAIDNGRERDLGVF
jgi:hypothetical protein